MKSSVAITLILCGVLVVAIPALSHAWDGLMLAVTLPHIMPNGSMNVGSIPDLYGAACWTLGTVMIGVAVVGSVMVRATESGARGLTAQVA